MKNKGWELGYNDIYRLKKKKENLRLTSKKNKSEIILFLGVEFSNLLLMDISNILGEVGVMITFFVYIKSI